MLSPSPQELAAQPSDTCQKRAGKFVNLAICQSPALATEDNQGKCVLASRCSTMKSSSKLLSLLTTNTPKEQLWPNKKAHHFAPKKFGVSVSKRTIQWHF